MKILNDKLSVDGQANTHFVEHVAFLPVASDWLVIGISLGVDDSALEVEQAVLAREAVIGHPPVVQGPPRLRFGDGGNRGPRREQMSGVVSQSRGFHGR